MIWYIPNKSYNFDRNFGVCGVSELKQSFEDKTTNCFKTKSKTKENACASSIVDTTLFRQD